jgi:hypothetical protein
MRGDLGQVTRRFFELINAALTCGAAWKIFMSSVERKVGVHLIVVELWQRKL